MAEKLGVRESEISGLHVVDLVVHGDNRGWFKENYQRDKMEALGLPPFEVVQNNVSFNAEPGTTRGLHAEPWEKFISVACGSIFGAWVDLRPGDNFGRVMTMELTPEVAVFVPRGVANGYQTIEPNTAYIYLVNDHWSPDTTYVFINLFDPELGIEWPITQDEAIISDKDRVHPLLSEVQPMEV